MVNIIGSVIFCLALVATHFCGAAVEMRVRTTDNQEADKVALGQPLIVELSVTDASGLMPQISIEGLDQAGGRCVGKHITTINNNTELKYVYHVSYDKPGTYQIGPATVANGANVMRSKTVMIEVLDQTKPVVKVDKAHKKKSKDPLDTIFLHLSADKSEVVVGEKITCTLTLLSLHDRVTLKQIGQEGTNNLKMHNSTGPVNTKKEVRGKLYNSHQWQWELYPEAAGEFLIPVYFADVAVSDERHGMVMLLLGAHERKKRIYSNSLKITVESLPDNVPPGTPVGIFKEFRAQLSPRTIKQGMAATLTLELTGDGNFGTIAINALDGIPPALRCYSSSQQTNDTAQKTGNTRKKFEFIVQALQAGACQIPAQRFSYFDIQDRVLKTIETEPLNLLVLPGDPVPTHQTPDDNDQPDTAQETSEINNDVLLLKRLHENQSWRSDVALPWSLFFILLALSCVWPLYLLGAHVCAITLVERRYRGALKLALRKLRRAYEQNNGAALHRLMIQFIAYRVRCEPFMVTESMVEQRLHAQGADRKKIEEWHSFWNKISAFSFGERVAFCADEGLFFEATEWLKQLETII